MAYTVAFDNTYPPGNTAANLISQTLRNKTTMIGERLVDIFGMPDYTSDPLKINYVRVGYGTSTKGGSVLYTNDAGVLKWKSGLDNGAGSTSFVIRDVVAGANRIAVDSASGVITTSAGISIIGNSGNSGHALTLTGVANAYATTMFAPNTVGQSFGLYIQAGTNSSDSPLCIMEATASQNLFQVRGDGQVFCYFGLTVTAGISGNVTGNVTGNVSGSSGSCTGNAATATTAGTCSGNAATATNSSQLGGIGAASYALKSGTSALVVTGASVTAAAFYIV